MGQGAGIVRLDPVIILMPFVMPYKFGQCWSVGITRTRNHVIADWGRQQESRRDIPIDFESSALNQAQPTFRGYKNRVFDLMLPD